MFFRSSKQVHRQPGQNCAGVGWCRLGSFFGGRIPWDSIPAIHWPVVSQGLFTVSCLCPFFFNKFIYFIYLFLAALGLHFCAWALSSCGERGLLFVAVHRLLIAVTSLVVEHGLQARGLQQLWHVGSVVVAHRLQSIGSVIVAHGLSCSVACGIFPDQGSNPCPLHRQADSQPLRHQGPSCLCLNGSNLTF